jgi:hypothetical protein
VLDQEEEIDFLFDHGANVLGEEKEIDYPFNLCSIIAG